MQYDIEWVKGLRSSDLILCNLLTFMRIYKYNLRFGNVSKNIVLEEAEAYGITKIKVKLKTKDDNYFTTQPYYIPDEEALLFKDKLKKYFEEVSGQQGGNNDGKEGQ